MVSWGVWLQLGHAGEMDCLMQCRCLLRPMWLVRSWSRIEACTWVSFETSCSHFVNGVVLSIAWMLGYLDEVFHRWSHLWCICSFFFCHTSTLPCHCLLEQHRTYLANRRSITHTASNGIFRHIIWVQTLRQWQLVLSKMDRGRGDEWVGCCSLNIVIKRFFFVSSKTFYICCELLSWLHSFCHFRFSGLWSLWCRFSTLITVLTNIHIPRMLAGIRRVSEQSAWRMRFLDSGRHVGQETKRRW